MLKFKTAITAAFVALCLVSPGVSGAPFCVEAQGIPAECHYYDIRSCKQEAGRQGGICAINPAEISVAGQGAPYCIIDSGMVPVCAFQGGESCFEQAARQNAVCFENTGNIVQNDPYRYERSPFLSE